MDERAATFVLGGALLVGAIAMGRAVGEEASASRAKGEFDEFEEQHYRAAGFRRASETPTALGEDLASLGVALVGVVLAAASFPALYDEVARLGK